MGTIVAVAKQGGVCLGCDAWNAYESQTNSKNAQAFSCILELQGSLIGLQSSVAFQLSFESAIKTLGRNRHLALTSQEEVFNFFLELHDILRKHYYMQGAFQAGQEFEWTPMGAILVNETGLYRIDSSRAVYKFSQYCAIGTGAAYALGAIEALFNGRKTAEQLVTTALSVCAELDPGSGKQFQTSSLITPTTPVALKKGSSRKKVVNLKKLIDTP